MHVHTPSGAPEPKRGRALIGRTVAGLVVLTLGAGGGAAINALGLASPAAAPVSAVNHEAAYGSPDLVALGELVVEDSQAPVAVAATAVPAPAPVKKVVKVVKAASAKKPAASVSAFSGAAAGASQDPNCDRLDDRKIQWLRRLVVKTRDANPSLASVAARIDTTLVGGLGKNMCAAEAQVYLNNMCADKAVHDFMQKSVKELPFFVRPLVGDPCGKDLVKAAQKYLP